MMKMLLCLLTGQHTMGILKPDVSHEEAGRELAFFFPNFRPPETELKPVKRMLALIQHNRARESREEILAR